MEQNQTSEPNFSAAVPLNGQLQLALAAAGIGTWNLDPSTRLITWDNSCRTRFGIDNYSIATEAFIALLHPDDRFMPQAAFRELLRSGKTIYSPRMMESDGAFHRVHITATSEFDASGTLEYISGIVQSAETTQAPANKKLEDNGLPGFRILADSMPQFVWLADHQGALQYFNKALCDYTGLNEEGFREHGWTGIVHPEERAGHAERWLHSITTGEDFLFQHRFQSRSGTYRWQLSRASPQRNALGQIQLWIGTSTDIHDQKLFQEDLQAKVKEKTEELQSINKALAASNKELAEANKSLVHSNEELAQYAYVASHDLQEPLRKITIFSSMLTDQDLPETCRPMVGKITQSVGRMSMLIHDLLEFSRLLKSDVLMRPVSLGEVAAAIVNDFELLIAEKGATIDIGPLPVIQAVSLQMNQLLYNLVGNALKFTQPHQAPHIDISAEPVSLEEAGRYIEKPDGYKNYYRLCVRDNGIGFESRYAEHIFEVFKRLHGRDTYPGSGIGLAVCRRIVANHGGALYAESEQGSGAAFFVLLPDRQQVFEPSLPSGFTWTN